MSSKNIDTIISKLSENNLNFLSSKFSQIKSLTMPLPNGKSPNEDAFQLIIKKGYSESKLNENIQTIFKNLTVESLNENLEKLKKKILAIQKRNQNIKNGTPPFLVKVYSELSKQKSNTEIQEISFSAYKISITSETLINSIKKAIREEPQVKILKGNNITDDDFLYFVILSLENMLLEEYSKDINIESLDFLSKNYSVDTKELKQGNRDTENLPKRNKITKNTRHKNPYLQDYIYSCNLKGKFLSVEFDIAGKLEDNKISFAAEFDFNKKDQTNLNIDKLTSDFQFDVIDWPKVDLTSDKTLLVKLYYSNNAFYGILNYGAYQLHLGLGKKKFLITTVDFSNDNNNDSSLIKDVFGINKVFLLIQNEGAITENHYLLEELKEAFNIEDIEDEEKEEEEEEEENDDINAEVKSTEEKSDKDSEIQSTPFDAGDNKDFSNSKFALATEIVKSSNDVNGNSSNLVAPILDFIGAEKISFYGLLSNDYKTFGLYIDQIGDSNKSQEDEKFFSIKNFKITYQYYKNNHRFKGASDLCFKIDEEEFELGIRALISKTEISFAGILNKDFRFNDRLILKNAALSIGYKNTTKSTTLGLAGMIEGKGLKNKTFNLQGAASFGIVGSTVRPTLLSAAVTSDKNGVNIADFIYSVSSIDLSFVPTFSMVNIEDLELTSNGVTVPEVLLNLGKPEEDILQEAQKSLISSLNEKQTNPEFQITGDYTITPLGNTRNYIVTDNVKLIHYKVTNSGGINLISQFYFCTEETTIGDNTYKQGIFIAGKITFLGVSSKFLFQVIKGDNPQESSLTAAISISKVNILGGLLSLENQTTPAKSSFDLKQNAPSSLQLFTKNNDAGPVMYCRYAGTPESLILFLNAKLKIFWGLVDFGVDIKIIGTKIEAYFEYKFLLFKANITFRADINNLQNGQFYLKLDIEVLSFNEALKNAAENTRKAGKKAKNELEKAKNNLKSKFDSRDQISAKIDQTKAEIDDTSWYRFAKLAKLGLKLIAYYAEYGVISVAIGILEAAVAVLQAAVDAASYITAAVLDAAAWVVEQLEKVFSIDSLVLEIDYTNNPGNDSKKIIFNAEADYTILGYKFNPKLELDIDFADSNSFFNQILDKVRSNADSIKKEIDDNQGKLPEKYIDKKDKKVDQAPPKDNSDQIKPEEIKKNTAKTIAYNNAIDCLYTLLIENEFAREYLSNPEEDGDDFIFVEMSVIQDQIVHLSKDSYLHSLNNSVTDSNFTDRQKILSDFAQSNNEKQQLKNGNISDQKEIDSDFEKTNNEKQQLKNGNISDQKEIDSDFEKSNNAIQKLKDSIERMNSNINSLSQEMKMQVETTTEYLLEIKSKSKLRKEFIKHYNILKNNES